MKFRPSFPILFLLILGSLQSALGQEEQSREERRLENDRFDDALIEEVEDSEKPDKVLHAEPLYIDLIRDLGARKGNRNGTLVSGFWIRKDLPSI